MKLSPALYVRSWISKLHPPMLNTARENRQLLSILNTSFQRRLDDAHPPIRQSEPMPHNSSRASALGPAAVDNDSANATMHHLQSLLQHPSLGRQTVPQTKTQHAAAMAVAMMDQAMLQGQADLGMIGKCLNTYGQTLREGKPTVLDEFRLGKKLSVWFMSSDSVTKDKFLNSTDLLRVAVPIMYADGQEEIVWEWLRMLYSWRTSYDQSSSSQWQDHYYSASRVIQECHLTFFMIREALRRRRLDAAVLQFIQACGYIQRTEHSSSLLLKARSSKPWQAATQAITMAILRRRNEHGLSTRLFDDLLDLRSSWSDSSSDLWAFELLSIYHPSSPSTKPLARLMQQMKDGALEANSVMKRTSKSASKTVLIAVLDAAQLMLKQDPSSLQQVRHLLDIIEPYFSPAVKVQSSDEASQRRIQYFRHLISPSEITLGSASIT